MISEARREDIVGALRRGTVPSSGLDALAVGNCYLRKEQQDPSLKLNYETAFELD